MHTRHESPRQSRRSDHAPSLLVIGYGNPLRRDDGLGPHIAALVESKHDRDVRVLTVHQLTPELAEPVSGADGVIFIDASIQTATPVEVRRIWAETDPRLRTHFAHPSVLLSLAVAIYGRHPEAWWITVLASDLGYGEGMSSAATGLVAPAVKACEHVLAGLRFAAFNDG